MKFNEMTPERRKEVARNGHKKMLEIRRRKKSMKETLELLLSLPVEEGEFDDPEKVQSFAKLYDKNVSVTEALMVVQVRKALAGDKDAMQFIRDTSGQKPKDEVAMEVGNSSKLGDIMDQLGGTDLDDE